MNRKEKEMLDGIDQMIPTMIYSVCVDIIFYSRVWYAGMRSENGPFIPFLPNDFGNGIKIEGRNPFFDLNSQ